MFWIKNAWQVAAHASEVAAVRVRQLVQRMIEAEQQNPHAVAPPIPLAPHGPLSERGAALAAA